MTSEQDLIFEEYATAMANEKLEEDSYYEALSTPLKSAKAIKEEHFQSLKKSFEFKELRNHIAKAEELIRNGEMISLFGEARYQEIIQQLDNIKDNIDNYYEENPESSEDILQKISNIPDETLINIYEFTLEFINKKSYEEAISLLTYLSLFAPDIPSFWLSLGFCLQSLGRDQEALKVFDSLKASYENPKPYLYSAISHFKLNQKDLAKIDLQKANELHIKTNDEEDLELINKLKNLLNSK